MKRISCILLIFISYYGFSQTIQPRTDTSIKHYQEFDTVTISALGKQSYRNIPYSIQQVKLSSLQKTPRVQLMKQLSLEPSVSSIASGAGINKPVIRGLSFNQIQLFAQGTRVDNQTWDDRHDIGISGTGFTQVEIVNGPAALLYGPNAMGGALVFHETAPGINEKLNGFAQVGYFGNSIGTNIDAGIREGNEHFYYSLNAGFQMHANYVQGEGDEDQNAGGGEEDKPLAPNSKFTNFALKGMVGTRNAKSQHQLNYSLYDQSLGIIEDESQQNNPPGQGQKEERDYEMEAPYQHVSTHIISTENTFFLGKSDLLVNAGYQYNGRKEFEPGDQPKSKELGVGLNLQTITGDVQWHSDKSKTAGIAVGIQGFYQDNKNIGNSILVPDAHISTIGAFILGHYNVQQWNFLAGVRIDQHQLNMFTTPSPEPDTLNPPYTRPLQQLKRTYTPASFSIGVVYHATKEFSIKLNAANGYAAPNYAELTAWGVHEGTYRFEIGDNNLNMEKNVEGDLTFQWANKDVELSLNGYINHIKDYIFITPTADSAEQYRIYKWAQHDADISGVELSLMVHPQQVAWFEGSLRAGIIRGRLANSGGDLPFIPANKVITSLAWKNDKPRKWQHMYATAEVGVYGAQNKVAQFEEETGGYVLTDIFLGVNPPLGKQHRWSVTAFCTNLFNVGYFNHLSLIKTIDIREPGRNIGLQLRFGF